jgi:hypothetical protein
MRRSWLCLLAVPALAGQPATAQDIPVPTAATLERMCSPAGAYQYPFAQTGVPGSSKLVRTFSKGLPLPATAAPFDHGKPWSTEWSDRFLAMEYTGPLLDEEAFELFAVDLDAALSEAGWELKPADYDPPIYMMIAAGDWTWTRPDTTAPEPAELVLGLSNDLGELTFTCGRSDLMLAHAQEALGKLPPGTPRPSEPTLPIAPVPTVADCARPAVAAEIDAFLDDGQPDSFTRSILMRADYQSRLSQWMMWRLEEAGAGRDELFRMAMDAAMLDGGAQGLTASLDTFLELLPVIGRLGEAKDAADRDGVCRAFVAVTGIYSRLADNGSAQTDALIETYRKEAPRFGVDPEE